MKQVHALIIEKVRIAKKGQITIPKTIRDEDGLLENDILIVTHLPGGDLVLRKQHEKQPEDLMLEAIMKAPSFDADEDWEEVKAERRRERS